ncbi:hypothetical protein ACQ4PT_003614 [Festuca glaucescens]
MARREASSTMEEKSVPLLLKSGSEAGEGLGRRLLEENKKLWVVAGPSICTRFSSFGLTVISQAFIGHIGATELAAFALVSTVLMRFSNGILLGMASALETLCGQSYGAKQYHTMGIHLQRSWIILNGCAVLTLPLYLFTGPLLTFIGQDPSICAVAGTISLWFIPVMFSYVLSFTLQMYLQAQGKNAIITYLAVANLALHLSLSWLLTAKYHLGLEGVMTSMIIAMWFPALAQLAFVLFGGCPVTWTGFSSAAFSDLAPMIKLSVSSGIMLWYVVRTSLCGFYLECKCADRSLSISRLGVAVGAGWQRIVAYVNITTYYFIGIPIGAILGYVLGYHVKGIWVGMLLGTLVQTIVLLFITSRTDWDKQVEAARERLNRWNMDASKP